MDNYKWKLKVIMLQLPIPEFTAVSRWGNTPWGAAMLKATALSRGLGEYFDIDILEPTLVNYAGDELLLETLIEREPDILCATLYLWNSTRSLAISGELKERLPGLRLIVGGPEISEETDYINKHPAVDFGCVGEGEEIFCAILESIAQNSPPPAMPGLFYRQGQDMIATSGRGFVKDLATLPSPLSENLLDIKNAPVVSYETMRGCSCSCTYCLTGTLAWRVFPVERVIADLKEFLNRGVRSVRISCSNFLGHPGFFAICDALTCFNQEKKMSLACFGYAEAVTAEKAMALKKANFDFVQLGVQSVNNQTLKLIRRPPFKQEPFVAGLENLRNAGIDFSLDVIAGLPGETAAEVGKTIAFVKDNAPRYNVFPLSILPGSPLSRDAGKLGIQYKPEPPYIVTKTAHLSREQITAYNLLNNDSNKDCSQYDFVRYFKPLGVSSDNCCDNRYQASGMPVNKIVLDDETNIERLLAAIGKRLANNIIVDMENLAKTLTPGLELIKLLMARNPHGRIKPIFNLNSPEEFFLLEKNVTQLCAPQISEKTLIRAAESGLDLASTGLGDFSCFDRFSLRSIDDVEVIAQWNNHNILVELAEALGIVELLGILRKLGQLEKKLQFGNLAMHYALLLVQQVSGGAIEKIVEPCAHYAAVSPDIVGEPYCCFPQGDVGKILLAQYQLLLLRQLREEEATR